MLSLYLLQNAASAKKASKDSSSESSSSDSSSSSSDSSSDDEAAVKAAAAAAKAKTAAAKKAPAKKVESSDSESSSSSDSDSSSSEDEKKKAPAKKAAAPAAASGKRARSDSDSSDSSSDSDSSDSSSSEDEKPAAKPAAKKARVDEEGTSKVTKSAEGGDNLTVFVKGLPFDTTDDDVKAWFAEKTDNAEIASFSMPKFEDSGRGRGIATITLKDQAGVDAFLGANNQDFNGRYVSVEMSKPKEAGAFSRGESTFLFSLYTSPSPPSVFGNLMIRLRSF